MLLTADMAYIVPVMLVVATSNDGYRPASRGSTNLNTTLEKDPYTCLALVFSPPPLVQQHVVIESFSETRVLTPRLARESVHAPSAFEVVRRDISLPCPHHAICLSHL